eukprot:TRINITY_DN4765_c0_g1_i1.p1 TRINITY_DN4765_c0_g1~~TRINITY_DN4765_c0_g1_i1.p1  ORF type:complete len:59 (+),score=8.02 TRINITY_DN4765_c0_g1_i1:292-468(+)
MFLGAKKCNFDFKIFASISARISQTKVYINFQGEYTHENCIMAVLFHGDSQHIIKTFA